jgi:amino acid adenylation domain-containing protein
VTTDRSPSHHQALHEAFREQAGRRPDAVAVLADGVPWTYRDIDEHANRLAHELRALGVAPETVVAVHQPRGAAMVVAMLAVLKAGGAYLPIDPAQHSRRSTDVLAAAGVRVVVSHAGGPEFAVPHVVEYALDDAGRSALPPPVDVPPATLAYVIFTSGSTGTPKGVMVEHRHVTALLAAGRSLLGFGPDDVWSQVSSPAFDFSVWEIWGALTHGGTLAVVPDDVRRAPDELYRALVRDRVTVLSQTPGAFRQLVRYEDDAGADPALALRAVLLGGEAVLPRTLRTWLERHPDRPALLNTYGITETTVLSTHHLLTKDDADTDRSPIGTALAGTTLRVLDAGLRAAGTGELYVGGAGVARGYLGRPGLTATRYLPDPAVPGARVYRSGDECRVGADGGLDYLGRLDRQLKVRGHRIEPVEIEAALLTHPGVRDAVVTVLAGAEGTDQLVAYHVPGEEAADPAALRAHLTPRLPAFLVPQVFVPVPELPLTANGKVDLAALPAPGDERPDVATTYVPPETALEHAVADIWAEVLGVDRVGLDDDFFELGGHSMLATRVVASIRERLGRRATLRMLFDEPGLRALVRALDEADTDNATDNVDDRETVRR